ncbi:glycosyltransferase family 2 protein [Devosia rhodophyticola]|uniref:Glycosyltransferase family 2 protein n=1 Tax=Devosia rhodophyticola TaxID=3026423 RepID=A0ABY7YYJ4_9HYPH|nr:glycosyltransferase family 2 protein [Devosia rhodophyticola]WDR06222.1 glycosyltransferase family 2 protein [Devosia rhodophyticola]
MAEQLDVSVIIPHLNEPDDLRLCLLALNAQQMPGMNFEIIVVDNGSVQMPDFATVLAPNVKLARELTPGPGPARNLGASLASAPILAFVDADCVPALGWLEVIVRTFRDNPGIDFAGGDIGIRPADARRLTAVECYESLYSYRARRYVERDGYAATGNMAVRTEVFRQVGPFGGIKTMEDTEWGKRASAMGHRIAYMSEARVNTPSCGSFNALARRWDRHVAHEFGELQGQSLGKLRWLIKSAVVAASPVAELFTVVRTSKLGRWRDRWAALACVTRVRLYRAQRMIGLAFRDDAAMRLDMWNRDDL